MSMRRRWSVSGVDSRRGGDERTSLRPETDLLLLLLADLLSYTCTTGIKPDGAE